MPEDIAQIEQETPAASLADQNGQPEGVVASAHSMIVFDGVTKIYEPNVAALSDVSFVIDKGEFVFVVGASGSGKSTVVRLLLKELEPTSGRIIVAGRDLVRLPRRKVSQLRRNVGCVFQDFKLLPNRTASENVAYALKVQGEGADSIRRKVPEVLNMVGLAHKMSSLPDELSGGEQQRVSIARAFVNHPPLLVCDEPTGNLDPDTSVGIMQLLYRINRSGTTVLMVTHDREMVDKMRRRVIALEDGKLLRDERRGWLRGVRIRVVIAEAWRSLTASLSTTLAAALTVLIGMFLVGLLIAFWTFADSWSNQQKGKLVVKVFMCTRDACPQEATPSEINAVNAKLTADSRVKSVRFVSKAEGLRKMQKDHPELFATGTIPSNPLPDSFTVTPVKGEYTKAIAESFILLLLEWRRPPMVRRQPAAS